MSSTDSAFGIRNMTDKATYERLEKDVTAVKNDIAALTEQITDALNSFANNAGKQARSRYKDVRANAEATPPYRNFGSIDWMLSAQRRPATIRL